MKTNIDMQDLIEKGPENAEEALRIDIFNRVNRLGIGAQGLGGLTTVVDVKIKTAPTHAASKPVCMIPNCAATRHIPNVNKIISAGELNRCPFKPLPRKNMH